MNERLSLPNYGGQAVIEGVLMRGAHSMAIAMRAPDQQIAIHTEQLGSIYKSGIARIPFLRGLILLWDSLGLGIRALTLSANLQTGEDEKLEGPALYLTLGISLAIGVGGFILVPAGLGQLAERFLGWSNFAGNILEGVIRLALLVAYIALVGRFEEIRRVFAYHGAEHKTINAFEAGVELTPENVSRFSVEHPRCGTAFLLTLALLSIILFAALGPLPVGWRFVTRILLLPVLAGLAYEYIRWTARHLNNPLVHLLVKPNLALQHLTTREPSLDMLEVSIAAFKAMRAQEDQSIPL
jgi:uncharacterized protein YqhQ